MVKFLTYFGSFLLLFCTASESQEVPEVLSDVSERHLVCGNNELDDEHVGCLFCNLDASPVQFANFVCSDAVLTRVSECSSQRNNCPYRPGEVCKFWARHSDFIYVGEAACFDPGNGASITYGRCVSGNRIVEADFNVALDDPRCLAMTLHPGGNPRK